MYPRDCLDLDTASKVISKASTTHGYIHTPKLEAGSNNVYVSEKFRYACGKTVVGWMFFVATQAHYMHIEWCACRLHLCKFTHVNFRTR